MAENKPIPVTLELVYVPDVYTETERQEGASWPLGSGFYDLVAVAGDGRLPLHRYKAGAVDKVFALAKQRQDEQVKQPATTQQQQAPSQQQTTTTSGTSAETTWQQPEQPPPPQQTPPPEQQQAPPPPEQQQQQ